MKNLTIYLIAGMMVVSLGFGTANAQTADVTIQSQLELISQLMEQVQQLQEQLNTIREQRRGLTGGDADTRQERRGLREEAKDVRSEQRDTKREIRQLTRDLYVGTRGADVEVLQALLSADPEIYPEGLVTGYFGPLTRAAVRKFQAKHGIEQVGRVGPKTRAAIEEELDENPIALQENEEGEEEPCAVLPPGHFIAPGWLRKQGGEQIVEPCQELPRGIAKKLSDDSDFPPKGDDDEEEEEEDDGEVDETAPVLSDVVVTNVTTNSADVTWSTDENTVGVVYYSTQSGFDLDNASSVLSDDSMTDHSVSLSGLSADTVYYYKIKATDESSNSAMTEELSFSSADENDQTAPVISGLMVSDITDTSAVVEWETDEPADSMVFWQTTLPFDTATADNAEDGSFVTSHAVSLEGLEADTTYYYVVRSADANGNTEVTTVYLFNTKADMTAPEISNVTSSNVTHESADITWDTDEDSDSTVYYSQSSPVDTATASSADSSDMVTSHSLSLSGLDAETTYYYVVESVDANANTATSTEQTFDTSAAPDETAPVISDIAVADITSSTATISWETDESSRSRVYYGTSTPVDTNTADIVEDAVLKTSHSLELSGLSADTTYYFVVESIDTADNAAQASEDSFATASGS